MFRQQRVFDSVRRVIAAGMLVLGLAFSTSPAQAQNGIDVPPVPLNIEVPPGHVPFLQGHAVGTQNFVCLVTKGGFAWTFVGPQATLFDPLSGDQQLTTHFLSVNPVDTTARPTWQHSVDSSKVWGRVAASSADPNFVEPGAIPWLRLAAAGSESGPGGGSLLAQTTFIQRLNTSGGVAPSTGCRNANDIGTMALVPYTADYIFYTTSAPSGR